MFFLSYGCSFIEGTASFRLAWGLQAVPAVVLIVALLFFPESPRWLASKGRWDDALNTLALLHGNGDITNPVVIAEYEEVKEAHQISELSQELSWIGLFKGRQLKRTIAGVFARRFSSL